MRKVASRDSVDVPGQQKDVRRALERESGLKSVHFRCEADLHRQLKQYALDHDTTVTELIVRGIHHVLSQ